jgi:hypothetical protein
MDFNFMTTDPQGGDRGNNNNVVTLSTFFESGDNNGYVKLDTFKALIKQLEKAHNYRKHYTTFFDCVKQGHLINGPVVRRTQRQNQKEYIFLNMKRGRMTSEAIVYLFDNLEKFITDYAERRISIDFNWKDLVEFCENH